MPATASKLQRLSQSKEKATASAAAFFKGDDGLKLPLGRVLEEEMANRVLLSNVEHHDLKLASRWGPEFGDSVNQMLIFPTEFEEAQREYPIFFRQDEQGEYHCVVLLGLDRGENLFLGESGWTTRYVPAVQRRGPFLIDVQEQTSDDEARRQPLIHVDLDDPRIGREEGEPLFLPHGGHAPALDRVSRALKMLHTGANVQRAMFAAFQELELVEKVTADVKLSDEQEYHLTRFHALNEEKFAGLDGAALDRLHRAGFLRLAVFVLSSLRNMGRLIDLKNRKLANA